MSNMADGLGFTPRVKEPESALMPGMAAPALAEGAGASEGVGAMAMPDTSYPGSVAAPSPATWVYDFDPATGSSRATFNGEVGFTSGGSTSAGVTTWNGRTGAVVLTAADVTGAGGAPAASPALTGAPTAPTAAPGTSSTVLATTAFVAAAIVASPIVQSFNGRTGAVTLTAGDVTGAGGAPAASPALTGVPTAPTAAQGTQSSQIASTQFVANAIASGAVTTWNGRQGAVSLTLSDVLSVGGAPIASPNFTGTPSGPTAAPGTATTQLASTQFVTNAITASASGVASFNGRTGAVTLTPTDVTNAGAAPMASPALTGTPTAPTATAGTNSTQLATCAFVAAAITAGAPAVSSWNGRTGAVTLQLTDVTTVGGAPLASPAFTGSPAGTTATPGDNSTRLATTAFVAAAIPAVPAASSSTPLMDGTAAIGTGTTFARADHVHPSDTSLYPASNPAGYQTAAQVTASLGSYLPLAGGTLTGNLVVSPAAGEGHVNINGTANAVINLNASAAGQINDIYGKIGGNLRWSLALGNGVAEGGGNAGSNLAIGRFTDAGTFLDNPIAVTRATGNVSLGQLTNGATYGTSQVSIACAAGSYAIITKAQAAGVTSYELGFQNSAGTFVGLISSTDTATTYATSSDARLKTEVGPFDKGREFLDLIQVHAFTWKATGGRDVGVIAQELDQIWPGAVSRGRGAPGDDDYAPWGVDYSRLVPFLIETLQKTCKIIDVLEARIETLEAQ